MALAERATEERAVLRVASDGPAVDGSSGPDHAVAGDRAIAQTIGEHPRAQDAQTAGVAQRLQALVGIETSTRGGDGGRAHLAAPRIASATLWPPNANELEIASGGWPLEVSSGLASPGT